LCRYPFVAADPREAARAAAQGGTQGEAPDPRGAKRGEALAARMRKRCPRNAHLIKVEELSAADWRVPALASGRNCD